MTYASDMTGRYNPLYFLSAVGAGGLAVSFFMYLMWLTPHSGVPIATFDTLATAWQAGGIDQRIIILLGTIGIAAFVIQHVKLLTWNVRQIAAWKQTPAYQSLRASNAETQLLAQPLAFAMAVNAGFIAGAVFVPGLWSLREWLFPLAILAFAATGVWAMRLLLAFFGRVLGEGGFDCAKNNSLGQLLGVFALAMIGVGFTAPAAMSGIKATVIVAYLGAVFFLSAAIVLGAIMLVLGFRAMMEHGAAEETTPTLWILIPILTVVGIGIYRLKMALAHAFGTTVHAAEVFSLLAIVVAVQMLFALIGWAVMRRVRYFDRWVAGNARSTGSYALVCPGVALTVSGFFLLNAGLVKLGLLEANSALHLGLHLPLIAVQFATIGLFMRLNRKLLAADADVSTTQRIPAVASGA
jgi:hypothetical protein